MKLFTTLSLITLLFFYTEAQTTFSAEDYRLVWSDEFDVDGLPNTDNWRYETGYSIRNNEAQNYTANRLENARVEDGHLIIEARRDNYQGHEISSASLVSWGKVVHRYGRFECRAKIDIRSGSWPAFWTLGERMEWPSNGEIDIMEYYQGKLLGNAAWGTETQWSGAWDSEYIPTSSFPDGWEDEFHIFMMEWTPDYIRLYVDDILINDVRLANTFNGSLGNYENPFRQPHYLILNQAIGGNNGGSYANTAFPIRYEVDYVRIYQRGDGNLDCNWEENGTAYLDDCGTCVEGNTGREACELVCEGNAIGDPDFETPSLSAWTGWGEREATSEAYEGNLGVAVRDGSVEQVVAVQPNTTYILSAMVRKGGGGAVFLGVKDHQNAETSLRIDNNTWQEKQHEFRTGNATSARIYLYNPEGGTGYGDNFDLRPKGCDLVTSVKNNQLLSVKVYPNPSSGSFTLQTKISGTLQVYNANGVLMFEDNVQHQLSYGDQLSAGHYILRYITSNGIETLSWVKF